MLGFAQAILSSHGEIKIMPENLIKCNTCYETKKELKKTNKGVQRLKDDLANMTEIAEEFEAIIEVYKEALEDIINSEADWCSERAKEALEKSEDM